MTVTVETSTKLAKNSGLSKFISNSPNPTIPNVPYDNPCGMFECVFEFQSSVGCTKLLRWLLTCACVAYLAARVFALHAISLLSNSVLLCSGVFGLGFNLRSHNTTAGQCMYVWLPVREFDSSWDILYLACMKLDLLAI